MIIDGDKIEHKLSIHADVCILGGGVAGLVLAKELATSFNKVVLLEAGGEHYSPESQDAYKSSSPNKSLFPDTSHSRLRFLGGSSNHWENNISPLDHIDFEKREWIPDSGWPISYQDIEPYYQKAGEYCGVGRDGFSAEHWSSALNKEDLVKDATILETGVAKASTPPVRFYAALKDELGKFNSLTIIKNATVVDIDFDSSKETVNKALFNSRTSKDNAVEARFFIMCFGGIENARMLLTFNEKYNDKLGNVHDNVGRYFMDHPLARAAHLYPHNRSAFELYSAHNLGTRTIVAFFKLRKNILVENELTNIRIPLSPGTKYELSDSISSHHIIGDALSEGRIPDDLGTHIINYAKDIDMVAEALSRKTFNTKLFDHANDFEAFELPVMIEQTPHRDNRIKLGERLDANGIKRIDIIWELKKQDKDRFWKAMELAGIQFGTLSLGRIKLLKDRSSRIWGDQLSYGHHHMGTTRMADSYNKGVVDKNLKVFGTKNFFVGGSSVFPTGGHVPPTLTIVALTIRLAEHLIKENQYA